MKTLQFQTRAISGRIPARLVIALAVMLLACTAVGWLGLMLGEVVYSPAAVLDALRGAGNSTSQLFVLSWRLPRVAASLVFGAMLGASGAVFQTITRNPLGSPDIIGFTTGAYTGGIFAILYLGSGFYTVAGGALAGGLTIAAVVYALSARGGVQGFRLIIVGIAITAALASLSSWLIVSAKLDLAIVAAAWGAGSLAGISFSFAAPAMVLGGVTIVLLGLWSRRLAQLDLGDDQAGAIGANPSLTRTGGIVLGVVLVALVTAVTGPIAFVALAAPQIGKRVARAVGTPIMPAALTGALLLTAADVVAQHAFSPSLPVGLVTVALGGLYLLALIAVESRKGTL